MLTEQVAGDEVRVIDEVGGQLGVFSIKDALRLARNQGLDLFLIQPDANPPLACIMDYGRYKFEQAKRAGTMKKRHHAAVVKELRMHYEINDHDYQLKVSRAQKALNGGDKINAQVLLRGREIEHADIAIALMKRFANDLQDLAVIDKGPHVEGEAVTMLLSPDRQDL